MRHRETRHAAGRVLNRYWLLHRVRARFDYSVTARSPGFRLRRALRLVVAIATVSAGLCLVLAMIVLVVAMGNTTVSRTASTAALAPAPAGRHAAVRSAGLRIGVTLTHYHGTGTEQVGTFQISRPGNWGVAWRFDCASGRQSQFTMTENTGLASAEVGVATTGRDEHGIWWELRDPGYHTLRVDSRCSWSVRVVLPWRPARKRPV